MLWSGFVELLLMQVRCLKTERNFNRQCIVKAVKRRLLKFCAVAAPPVTPISAYLHVEHSRQLELVERLVYKLLFALLAPHFRPTVHPLQFVSISLRLHLCCATTS